VVSRKLVPLIHFGLKTVPSTVLITGASSGIGLATSALFLAHGWNVVATMRSVDESLIPRSDRLLMIRVDVTDSDSIHNGIAAALDRFKTLDVIVNNAGYAVRGPFEGVTDEQLVRQMDTNVIGLMRVTAGVLPHLRSNGGGTIVNMSSVSGRITIPFYSLYHASKWAIEGFSESLAYELRPLGIRVKVIEPGPIKTSFYGRSLDIASDVDGAYARAMDRSERVMQRALRLSGDPEDVARAIYRASTGRSWRLRYPVHSRGLLAARALVPTRLLTRLTGLIMLGRSSRNKKGRQE
jgi:NAD(P)-dependent dehydrogenase (short-subunit alcohol dehydrogenase family)